MYAYLFIHMSFRARLLIPRVLTQVAQRRFGKMIEIIRRLRATQLDLDFEWTLQLPPACGNSALIVRSTCSIALVVFI